MARCAMAKKSKAEKKAEKAAEQARLEAERLEAERRRSTAWSHAPTNEAEDKQ